MSDLKLTVSHWGEVALDKRELRKLMRSAGNDIKTKTARLINKAEGGGRHYSAHAATKYRPAAPAYTASTPGSPPAAPTNTLRASLKNYVYPTGEGFAVRARQFYALFLEAGAKGGGNPGARAVRPINRRTGRHMRAKGVYTTRVLEARPFLDRVMAEQAGELNRRVKLAIDKSLTWKETKLK
jgi:hypothetical protein